ncbi:MAG: Sak single strand annealing protein [Pseudomonadales bacterium]|tara:strand:+ start:208 stop:747 length:540 start_codon:yes stop_codon:yes gene_type:complete
MSNSIWATLSAINCNEHIEKKGQFSYLAWTWALAMTREHYPDMTHAPQPDVIYADGSMEVRCTVSIEGQTHPMWLPVLDFKNKAIANPNAFDINTARMRCLVKNLAVNFGLGHYIFAGESLPQEVQVAEDISAEVFALNESKTLDELQAVFKRAWSLFPRSRPELTKAKDTKKKELANG